MKRKLAGSSTAASTFSSFLKALYQIRLFDGVLVVSFAVLAIASSSHHSEAQSSATSGVSAPPELRAWEGWVKDRNPEWNCARKGEKEFLCGWETSVDLALLSSGATFSYRVSVDRDQEVMLPGGRIAGGDAIWPIDVKLSESHNASGSSLSSSTGSLTIIEKNNRPYAYLKAGQYVLRGRFEWSNYPRSVPLPRHVGLIRVTKGGVRIPNPRLASDGSVLLASEEPAKVDDTVSVRVFRNWIDAIPLITHTHIELSVGGRARELVLPKVLPHRARPWALRSPLPARLTETGDLHLNLRPGTHRVLIESFIPGNVSELKPNSSDGEWLSEIWPSEEIWIWQSDEQFRSVELSGAPQVDGASVGVPVELTNAPAYVVSPLTVVSIKELRRGMPQLPPDRLTLNREFVLDVEGRGMTVADQIVGELNSSLRINAQQPFELGSVNAAGQTQVVTLDPETDARGVEIRRLPISIRAISRVESPAKDVPVSGWTSDFEQVAINLRIPPGNSLLWAEGADSVSGSWVSSWTLFDFFILLFATLSFGKLFGISAAALAFLTLLLCHGRVEAPFLVWFSLLGSVALLRVVPEGTFRLLVRWYFRLSMVVFVFTVVPFVANEVLNGLYPQLADGRNRSDYKTVGLLQSAGTAFDGTMAGEAFVQSAAPAQLDEGSTAYRNRAAESIEASKMISRTPQPMADAFGGSAHSKRVLEAVDPSVILQVGPGFPDWNWSQAALRWNSRVTPEQRLSLVVIGPRANLVLGFVRALLVLTLIAVFFRARPGSFRRWKAPDGLFCLLFAASALVASLTYNLSSVSAQEFPPSELLDELQKRLEAERCQSNCISTQKLEIRASEDEIRLTAVVSSRGINAWPVPGPTTELLPETITINGSSQVSLRRDGANFVFLRLPEGTHVVEVVAPAPKRQAVTLQFGLNPGHLSSTTSGWNVDGILPNGGSAGSVQLVRTAKEVDSTSDGRVAASIDEEQSTLVPHFIVTREFELGVEWRGTIVAERKGDLSSPASLAIPLYAGESIESGDANVNDRQLVFAFPRNVSRVSADVRFDRTDLFQLKASTSQTYSEVWNFSCSTQVECRLERPSDQQEAPQVPVTSYSINGSKALVFRPFAGEEANISVLKPEIAEGNSLLINSLSTSVRPADRETDVSMNFAITASKAESFSITLPEDSEVQRVLLDGRDIPVGGNATNVVTIPMVPAADRTQHLSVEWRYDDGLSVVTTLPQVEFSSQGVNGTINLSVPQDRWLLFADGPSWGPAILFWPKLLVVLIFAVALARARITPLSTLALVFLGLGIANLSLLGIAGVLGWFVAFHVRKTVTIQDRLAFNFFQILLGFLTFIAVLSLIEAVRIGLILYPEMQVVGAGSGSSQLAWYVDRFVGELPSVKLISLPIAFWRGFMLIWSVWLALSLLRWARWGWEAFSTDKLWIPRPERKRVETGNA